MNTLAAATLADADRHALLGSLAFFVAIALAVLGLCLEIRRERRTHRLPARGGRR